MEKTTTQYSYCLSAAYASICFSKPRSSWGKGVAKIAAKHVWPVIEYGIAKRPELFNHNWNQDNVQLFFESEIGMNYTDFVMDLAKETPNFDNYVAGLLCTSSEYAKCKGGDYPPKIRGEKWLYWESPFGAALYSAFKVVADSLHFAQWYENKRIANTAKA